MSHPFFRCVSCSVPVQRVVLYDKGKLPPILASHRDIPTTDGFEEGDPYRHCRGQGTKHKKLEGVKHQNSCSEESEYHFNFSGIFQNYCCFCAMHACGDDCLFMDVACYLCTDKNAMIRAFMELYRTKGTSWQTHGWAALPSAILDKIVGLVIAGGTLAVEDGAVVACRPGV
jgi:hypothetical protein